MLPEITKWQIDSARQHATNYGKGAEVQNEPITRNRLNEAKVDHFIDFISDPIYLKTASYGEITLKLSTGQQLQMPNVKRTLHSCHLIDTYMKYCDEEDFQPLSRRTLFRLLKVCEATYTSTMQGLDNITALGNEAFANLSSVVITHLEEAGITNIQKYREKLETYHHYMKTAFKSHLTLHSDIPDHCITYALSDPESAPLQVIIQFIYLQKCQIYL